MKIQVDKGHIFVSVEGYSMTPRRGRKLAMRILDAVKTALKNIRGCRYKDKYKATRKPKCGCVPCWNMWHKVESKRILEKINKEKQRRWRLAEKRAEIVEEFEAELRRLNARREKALRGIK